MLPAPICRSIKLTIIIPPWFYSMLPASIRRCIKLTTMMPHDFYTVLTTRCIKLTTMIPSWFLYHISSAYPPMPPWYLYHVVIKYCCQTPKTISLTAARRRTSRCGPGKVTKSQAIMRSASSARDLASNVILTDRALHFTSYYGNSWYNESSYSDLNTLMGC